MMRGRRLLKLAAKTLAALAAVVGNNNETPTLYLNDLKRSGNAVELKLVGARSNRDALVMLTAGGKTLTRQVEAGSGSASESMRTLHFGLGAAGRIDAVEIAWPSGRVQHIAGEQLRKAVGVNRLLTVEESPESSTDAVGGPPQ